MAPAPTAHTASPGVKYNCDDDKVHNVMTEQIPLLQKPWFQAGNPISTLFI